MKNKLSIILIGTLLILAAACKKKTPPVVTPDPPKYETSKGVFVINEGQFQAGNASITYYKFNDKSITNEVFKTENNRPLGDICQSAIISDGKIYIVVNNSGKIEVVNAEDFKAQATVNGFVSPRYIANTTGNKAYVTNLFGGQLDIVNTADNTISGQIPLSGWSEEMFLNGNDLFICNAGSDKLYVLDIGSNQIKDSIQTGAGVSSIRKDKDNNLWVLCGGDFYTSAPASLHKINMANLTVTQSLTFGSGEFPGKLQIDDAGENLYFINTDIFKMNYTDTQLPSVPFISSNGKSFYGLGVDNSNQRIYVGDAINFSQNGKAFIYTEAGLVVDSFSTGIAPNGFLFY